MAVNRHGFPPIVAGCRSAGEQLWHQITVSEVDVASGKTELLSTWVRLLSPHQPYLMASATGTIRTTSFTAH